MKSVLKFLAIIVVSSSIVGAGIASAADYKIDPAHSFIQFKTKHLGYSWLIGRFNDFEGSFTYDPTAGADVQKINVTINTNSVDTNWADREKHLRGGDFLEVDKHPVATFVSTGYSGDGNVGVMAGDLTLHGVTKPIEITVERIGEGPDPWGGYRAGFTGKIMLTRSDFGITYDLGPTSTVLEMDLFVEGIRQ